MSISLEMPLVVMRARIGVSPALLVHALRKKNEMQKVFRLISICF